MWYFHGLTDIWKMIKTEFVYQIWTKELTEFSAKYFSVSRVRLANGISTTFISSRIYIEGKNVIFQINQFFMCSCYMEVWVTWSRILWYEFAKRDRIKGSSQILNGTVALEFFMILFHWPFCRSFYSEKINYNIR